MTYNTLFVVFKGTGEIVSVFVHDVKSSSEDKVIINEDRHLG